jgi:hypothetical protein
MQFENNLIKSTVGSIFDDISFLADPMRSGSTDVFMDEAAGSGVQDVPPVGEKIRATRRVRHKKNKSGTSTPDPPMLIPVGGGIPSEFPVKHRGPVKHDPNVPPPSTFPVFRRPVEAPPVAAPVSKQPDNISESAGKLIGRHLYELDKGLPTSSRLKDIHPFSSTDSYVRGIRTLMGSRGSAKKDLFHLGSLHELPGHGAPLTGLIHHSNDRAGGTHPTGLGSDSFFNTQFKAGFESTITEK